MSNLFSDQGFMPHSVCLQSDPVMIWLMVLSNGAIAGAYYAIPIMLVYLAKEKTHLLFNWFSTAFAIFIFACGTGHVMDVIVLWRPMYWLQVVINGITAGASIYTAIVLAYYLPIVAAALKDPDALEKIKELQVKVLELLASVTRNVDANIVKR